MDRLVATHSVPLAQADKVPTEGVAQYATDGSPAQNIPATIFTASQYNSVMDEVVNAIEAGGLQPDRNQWNQLATIIKQFKNTNDLFAKAISLEIIKLSESENTIIADFNTGNNAFHGWSTFFATIEINRDDTSSQNCLMFSFGQGDNRKPSFYIAGDDKNFTIAAANQEDISKSEVLMTINKETKEFIINGTLKPSGADLAEYYHADQSDYIPGTVMMFGGENEITVCTDTSSVFGVISTKPAFVMNSSADLDNFHYPIVLTGRVPVRVKGIIKKHDKITANIDGTCKAADDQSEYILGTALEDKLTEEEGMVSCFVQAFV